MSKYVVQIGVGRLPADTLIQVKVFDFSSCVGGVRRTVPFSVFQHLKSLSSDPVDLWETVPVLFGGMRFAALVDEEGLIRDPPDPINLACSLAAGRDLHGDVFILRPDPPDLVFLDMADVLAICDEFVLDPDPIIVELPADE